MPGRENERTSVPPLIAVPTCLNTLQQSNTSHGCAFSKHLCLSLSLMLARYQGTTQEWWNKYGLCRLITCSLNFKDHSGESNKIKRLWTCASSTSPRHYSHCPASIPANQAMGPVVVVALQHLVPPTFHSCNVWHATKAAMIVSGGVDELWKGNTFIILNPWSSSLPFPFPHLSHHNCFILLRPGCAHHRPHHHGLLL